MMSINYVESRRQEIETLRAKTSPDLEYDVVDLNRACLLPSY